jgi:hypothetical protein
MCLLNRQEIVLHDGLQHAHTSLWTDLTVCSQQRVCLSNDHTPHVTQNWTRRVDLQGVRENGFPVLHEISWPQQCRLVVPVNLQQESDKVVRNDDEMGAGTTANKATLHATDDVSSEVSSAINCCFTLLATGE